MMTKLSKAEIGTISEHQAIINLTKKGYMVAKSCSPQCSFDLVAVHPNGKIKLLDIKTKSFRKKDNYKINRCLNKKQRQLGVKLLTMDLKI